tara:strand:- start:150 stop:482 length:333 start_codon:yes stop_codon:yes gene_type:complete
MQIVPVVQVVMEVAVVTAKASVFLWASVHRKHRRLIALMVRFVTTAWSVCPPPHALMVALSVLMAKSVISKQASVNLLPTVLLMPIVDRMKCVILLLGNVNLQALERRAA